MFDSIFSLRDTFPNFFPFFIPREREGERESQTEFPHCTNNSFVLSVTWARAVGVEVCSSRTRIGYRKLNWLNLTFGAADEHNGRWVFNGSSCISSSSSLSLPFYRKPVAQLQCIRAAHPCPGYSLYHFDTNLKFFSKKKKKRGEKRRLVRCVITKPRAPRAWNRCGKKTWNDNIYAEWGGRGGEQRECVVEVVFSRVYYGWLIEFGWRVRRNNEALS